MDKIEFDLPSNALVIMVGVQGSGKTTLARRIAKENTLIVSTDDIHEEKYGNMTGESDEQINGDEIFEEFFKRIRNGLEQGKQVIADAVSISRYKRADLYNIAKEYSVPIRVVVMNVMLDQTLKQNSQRERHIPEERIKAMYDKMKYRTIRKDKDGNVIKDDKGNTKWNPSEYERIGWEIKELCDNGYDAKTCSVYVIPQKENNQIDNER
jgi:predicted kinase